MQLTPKRPWRRLQWQLTGLFVLTTALATLLVYLAITGLIAASVSSAQTLREIEKSLKEGEKDIGGYFAGATPDRMGLTRTLDQAVLTEEKGDRPRYLSGGRFVAAVADASGVIVSSSPDDKTFPPGKKINDFLNGDERQLIERARRGEFTATWSASRMIASGPVRRDGKLVALSFVRTEPLFTGSRFWGEIFGPAAGLLLLAVIGSSIVGGIVGYFAAKSVTRRLTAISGAADMWAAGDFSAKVAENPPDELGLLARRLNLMAGDLRQMMALRDAVAALEERQRITRDLHDTIKQEAFATALMVGSAKQSLDAGDDANTRRALGEAYDLSRQMQTDLSGILGQLRADAAPALAARLESLAAAWRRRSGVSVTLRAEDGGVNVAPAIAEQTARVVEEAVANAVKHSGGRNVAITLRREEGDPETLRLTVADDGAGFDPATARSGMGLSTMRERAALLPGGHLEIAANPGGGTRITLRFRAGTGGTP